MDQFDEQFMDSGDVAAPLRSSSPFVSRRNGDSADGAETATTSEDTAIYTDDPVRVYLREMGSV